MRISKPNMIGPVAPWESTTLAVPDGDLEYLYDWEHMLGC